MDKDKGKGKKIAEDPFPSRKVRKGEASTSHHVEENEEQDPGETPETEYVRVVTIADYEDAEIDSWDWRDYPGVIGPVVDQGDQATCWAVAIVRAVQALLNIGVCRQQQLDLSMQHIVNNVAFDPNKGISNIKLSLGFMRRYGVCVYSQCPHRGELKRKLCSHKQVHCHTVDSFTVLDNIEDVDLEEMVRRQPVVALIPISDALQEYDPIYNNWLLQHDRIHDGPNLEVHEVIIVGYGNRQGKPYWIIQNSWGVGWGDGGYAYVQRQTVRRRRNYLSEQKRLSKKSRTERCSINRIPTLD